MNHSDFLVLNGIRPRLGPPPPATGSDLKSPNGIGSSATAIGVASIPVLLIILVVLGYKLYSKYFSRAHPRHLYLKRGSAVTSLTTISSSTEYTAVPRPSSPTYSDEFEEQKRC